MPQGRADRLRSRLPTYEEALRLSRQAQALAEPTRVLLMSALIDSEKSVCVSDLCLIVEREQSGVSRNLRILWEAGLVKKEPFNHRVYYEPTPDGERLLMALLA